MTASPGTPSTVLLRRAMGGPLPAAVVVAAALLATSPMLPMGWDEGNAILRAEGILRWFGRWGAPDTRFFDPFSRASISADWRYTTQIEGHPAFYGIVIAAGRALSAAWLSPLDSWRAGPMLLFALAAGAMFFRMAKDYSLAAAAGAVAALILVPRLFAHAHFASIDGPLTSCWMLAWAAFSPARSAWRWAIAWGIALGMTLSSKATGWIAPLPFLAWTAIYRDRGAAKTLLAGIPVALATFFLLNPPLWHDPIDGWLRFFWMNLDRRHFNISTQFFGHMCNLDHPLPWYNTLVWVGITVPVAILLLMLIGSAVVCRRWRCERAGILLMANALVLMVVRATPWAPPHDAERLFLPAFAFLAALAGIGCHWLLTSTVEENAKSSDAACASAIRGHLAAATVFLAYALSATSLFWYAPQWLSYYNLAIGGLPGAAAVGMEPTYYWDALDRAALEWLDRHTGAGDKACFAAGSMENLHLMRRWGTLRPEFRPDAPGQYRWYVLQRRPSALQRTDLWLIDHGTAAYRKTIRTGAWGPWRLDVPLVEVYSYHDYVQAAARVGR